LAADPGGAEAQAADRAAAAPAEDGATGQALGAEEAPAAEDEEVRGGKEERGGGAGCRPWHRQRRRLGWEGGEERDLG